MRCIALLCPFDPSKAPFVEEKSIKSPEMPPRSPAAWVFPDEMSAMINFVHCNGELTTLSVEIIVRFIALLSPFNGKQGPVCG